MRTDLKNDFNNLHKFSRQERTAIANELLRQRPEFLKEFTPKWWWFRPCVVNVLIVTDVNLDFTVNPFGLSEFLTAFNKLEQQSLTNIKYKVTIAHRDPNFSAPNPDPNLVNSNSVIVNRISGFKFDTSVVLNDFDQVWLFGIDSEASISNAEILKIEDYMNKGGGLFATGDHGFLGSAMCGQIPRVKDMRLWADTAPDPNPFFSPNPLNEVGMRGERRNDTNRPGAGQTVSTLFQNQSDDIPQNIAVRTFGAGLPHPLLSISPSKRPSGIIDIMPDHPHEGECTQEKIFTVTNPVTNLPQQISSQIIATSFVLGGSTSGGKAPTLPHCFPSISVFDGRSANVGRIVIDSTWHHFVNINLNGVGGGVGLSDNDFDVVQQYFMNIATWMTRRKLMLCWRKWIWINLLKNSQLIEASLNNPKQKLTDIKTEDLYSIGMLAKEIIANEITPAFAEEFMLDMIENVSPSLSKHLSVWDMNLKNKNSYFINLDYLVSVAIGCGFIALRDKVGDVINSTKFDEKSFEKVPGYFDEGVKYGMTLTSDLLKRDFEVLNKEILKSQK